MKRRKGNMLDIPDEESDAGSQSADSDNVYSFQFLKNLKTFPQYVDGI